MNEFNSIGNARLIIREVSKVIVGKDESLIGCFTEPEDRMIARSLIAWINDGSHSIPDDLYIDSYTDAVPKYKEVFRRMFYESGHKEHYKMMMRISDEPEEENDFAGGM